MLFTGLLHGISYLCAQAFLESRAPELGQDVILTVMGAAFLCEGSGAVGIMGITWGLLGLRKAAETINEALRRAYRRILLVMVILPPADVKSQTGKPLRQLEPPFNPDLWR